MFFFFLTCFVNLKYLTQLGMVPFLLQSYYGCFLCFSTGFNSSNHLTVRLYSLGMLHCLFPQPLTVKVVHRIARFSELKQKKWNQTYVGLVNQRESTVLTYVGVHFTSSYSSRAAFLQP